MHEACLTHQKSDPSNPDSPGYPPTFHGVLESENCRKSTSIFLEYNETPHKDRSELAWLGETNCLCPRD